MLESGEHYKYIDLPLSNYASSSYDKVLLNGNYIGLSMFSGYSYNERSMLSLGVVDPDLAIGSEVEIVLGRRERRIVKNNSPSAINSLRFGPSSAQSRTPELHGNLMQRVGAQRKSKGHFPSSLQLACLRNWGRFLFPERRHARSKVWC